MAADSKERRTQPRVPLKQFDVVYHRRKNWFFFEKGKFKSPIMDISDGGVSLLSSDYLPIGTRLAMHFESDTPRIDVPKDFSIEAVVVYSAPAPEAEGGGYRTGLRFAPTDDATMEAVHKIIRQALESAMKP